MDFDEMKKGEEDATRYPVLSKYTEPVKRMDRELVGRDKEMQVLWASMARPELCNVILLGDAGSGKAHPDDTLVPVADGRVYARIGDLNVGDRVFGRDGRPVTVTGIFQQGMLRKYLVHFSDGSVVPCNDGHLWDVRLPGMSSYETVTLRDIMDRGLIADYPWRPVVPSAGSCMWDGGIRSDAYALGSMIRGNVLVTDDLVDGIRSLLGTEPGSRREFVMGVMGITDVNIIWGFVSARCAVARIGNEGLARIVRQVFCSLGLSVSVVRVDTGDSIVYDLYFCTECAMVSVEDTGEDVPMRCIMVDAPDHLYQVTEGHVVTHNTALVQGTMAKDAAKRRYLSVNISTMLSDCGAESLPGKLEELFAEVVAWKQDSESEVVLFIDEFHRIVQSSPAAVEALKPLLADSGTRGIRLIAATTYAEFREWVAPNQALVERLQRINLSQPDKSTTVAILKDMAKTYGVDNLIRNSLYDLIYEYTERYIPANSQPRKSILVLDCMVGWHRAFNRPFNKELLAHVIYVQENINVSFSVDASSIKQRLDERVFDQEYATAALEKRLQVCVADLNDKTRPMASFLFAGPSGCGKGIIDDEVIPVLGPGGVAFKRNGDLEVGDVVFNRQGQPRKVTGVYHRGLQDVYKVTLADGRSIIVDGSHLWTWHNHSKNDVYRTMSTQEMYNDGVWREDRGGGRSVWYYIPMNGAVHWPDAVLPVDPYALGVVIGNGSLSSGGSLTVCCGDEYLPYKMAGIIGGVEVVRNVHNYNWRFAVDKKPDKNGRIRHKYLMQRDFLAGLPEIMGRKSYEMYIPDAYKHASVSQRWQLVQAMFDANGSISSRDGERYNVHYFTSSRRLADDLCEVLFSLGVGATVKDTPRRDKDSSRRSEWRVHVSISNEDKHLLFTHPRKLEIAERAAQACRVRRHRYDDVAIVSMEKLPDKMPTTCIMVDDDEHLYLAGRHCIVTHNTEMAKCLSKVLFDDSDRLIRMDMTEYANEDSLERFRDEITAKVWARPHSIVLLDEIEKACGVVTRLLLQVLDDGRLIDGNNREVVFTNAYIIMTTNSGADIYSKVSQYSSETEDMASIASKYDNLLRRSLSGGHSGNKFPPELLGRIDSIVMFRPIGRETMRRIMKSKMHDLCNQVRAGHNVVLKVDSRVFKYLIDDNADTHTEAGGARGIVGKFNSEVVSAVAKYINENKGVRDVGVTISGDMVCDNKNIKDSTAKVVVGPYVDGPARPGLPMSSGRMVK